MHFHQQILFCKQVHHLHLIPTSNSNTVLTFYKAAFLLISDKDEFDRDNDLPTSNDLL